MRAVRSIRRAHGDLHVLPIEAAWLAEFQSQSWRAGLVAASESKPPKSPKGGETKEWLIGARELIRRIGNVAGFVVADPFVPPSLQLMFELAKRQRPVAEFRHTIDPIGRKSQPIRRSADFLTRCEIDLAWLMPLPLGLQDVLAALLGRDRYLAEEGIIFPELWSEIPLVAFELETVHGKHAGGGLLNLAAFGVLGVAVTPDESTRQKIAATIATYQPTLGLRNLFAKAVDNERF